MGEGRRTRWRELAERAEAQAAVQGGVIARARLRELGVDRGMEARLVRNRRWARCGSRAVATHTAPLGHLGLRWRAVIEVGGDAMIDGVSALLHADVSGLSDEVVHVSVHHLARAPRVEGVLVHKVSRRCEPELQARALSDALPCTPVSLATLRAAQWAVSDRQAALFLVLPVQQRLVRPSDLRAMHEVYRGRRRRALVSRLIDDVDDGAHSLGELDFAAACRRRGLPEPSRQQVVRCGDRRAYLDVRWDEVDLVVEIDGSQHRQGLAVSDDNFRQNAVSIRSSTVLRIDLVGLRLQEDRFMDQVVAAFETLRRREPKTGRAS